MRRVTGFSAGSRASDRLLAPAYPGLALLNPPLPGLQFLAFPLLRPPHTLFGSCAEERAPRQQRPEKWVTIARGRTMDDIPCQDFFLHPTHVLHRQYEAVRAVFLERRPLAQVAREFGYRYGSLRNLVADFRARCRAGQPPPFSPNRSVVGLRACAPPRRPVSRKRRPPPTVATLPSRPGGACAPAWPGSSCSCRCWPACTSTRW